MNKVVLYSILGLGIIVSFLIESCASTGIHESCKINKVSSIYFYDDSTYSVSVLFNSKTTKEQRKDILLQKITENYPQLIFVDEHPGKRYNEYWYKLKTRDTSIFQLSCDFWTDTVNYFKMPDDIMDCLTEVGKDNYSALNDCESRILNYKYKNKRGDFDFSNKKVAFFSGNTGKIMNTKEWYFDQLKKTIDIYSYVPWESASAQLVFFNEDEAKQTSYDAVIFCACKKYISKKEAIDRLMKK
ncbi:MAG: hypothetical protein K6E93_05120 [Bacteroidales bacterium]|nr:hypothetical protein [Bacteroidales bacterium]